MQYHRSTFLQGYISSTRLPPHVQRKKTLQDIFEIPYREKGPQKRKPSITASGRILTENILLQELKEKEDMKAKKNKNSLQSLQSLKRKKGTHQS